MESAPRLGGAHGLGGGKDERQEEERSADAADDAELAFLRELEDGEGDAGNEEAHLARQLGVDLVVDRCRIALPGQSEGDAPDFRANVDRGHERPGAAASPAGPG